MQGEVVAGTILQQSFIVEYVVNHQMCDDCRRVEAKDTWNASVSINWFVIGSKIGASAYWLPNVSDFIILMILFLLGATSSKNWPKENSLLCRTIAYQI